jgi:natural product precursor
MKKLSKLKLKKEVIAKLNDEQLSDLKGGTGTNSTVCNNPYTETIGWATCVACINTVKIVIYGLLDMTMVLFALVRVDFSVEIGVMVEDNKLFEI